MKKTIRCLLSVVCLTYLSGAYITAEAASTKTHSSHSSSSKANKKATSKTNKKSTKTTSNKTAKPSGKSGKSNHAQGKTAGVSEQTCKTVRVKTSKGYRNQRKCSSAEVALHNPAGAGDMSAQADPKSNELKARTIPDRAYAVDGYTFFHQGRKYRILGINEGLVPAGSDMAKQRLQLALDSGAITVEPDSVDENGTMRALVRVGGKNLADVLNASP
jgi:hypothetical protein